MGLNASVAGKRSLPGFQLTCRNSYCTLKIVELKMAAAAGGVPFCVRVFETVVLVASPPPPLLMRPFGAQVCT